MCGSWERRKQKGKGGNKYSICYYSLLVFGPPIESMDT